MFRHINDVIPKMLADELLRLVKLDRNWCTWKSLEPPQYTCETRQQTWLRKLWQSGADAFSMWANSIWLVDGPKVFRPTPAQCRALEQIEVRLELSEYSQPYPALLVDLPTGYEPYTSILCFKTDNLLVCVSQEPTHLHDIVTTVAVDGRPLEVSLQRYDDDCKENAKEAGRALRVALNSCLALSNYGCHADYLYPKDVETDERLAEENTERGERARKRLEVTPSLVRFDREVVLHRPRPAHEQGEPTGREREFGWVRGHWKMQAHGPSNTLRKRILIKPYMIRADKLIGELSDTSVTYRT
jgi:hypothetical protein